MEYKTITRPDGSEQQLAVYDGKCRVWREGIYDSLRDTAAKRAVECSLPVKIDRREDGTVSVGTQSLVPWDTDYGKLEIMADVYLNYLAQVFNLPDDGFVRTKLAFGGESAEHDGVCVCVVRDLHINDRLTHGNLAVRNMRHAALEVFQQTVLKGLSVKTLEHDLAALEQ